MHWKILDNPPYSPDLSPCDYFLFVLKKELLGGERFKNNDEVEEYVRNWLMMRPQNFFFEQGMSKLPNSWQKCVECREKLKVSLVHINKISVYTESSKYYARICGCRSRPSLACWPVSGPSE